MACQTQYKASCALCGYNTGTFESADAIVICKACRTVVAPRSIPFRLDPIPCPSCNVLLRSAPLVLAKHGYKDANECPKCGKVSLDLTVGMVCCDHGRHGTPGLGQSVHGWYRGISPMGRPRVRIKDTYVPKTYLSSDPKIAPGLPIEAVVTGCVNDILQLDYVRVLGDNEIYIRDPEDGYE